MLVVQGQVIRGQEYRACKNGRHLFGAPDQGTHDLARQKIYVAFNSVGKS